MYLVIGLRRDGKLSLADANREQRSLQELEELAKDFDYMQLLVVEGSGCAVARFEVHESPLWQVGLAE